MATNNMPTLLAEATKLGQVQSKLAEAQALMQSNRPAKTFAKRAALYIEAGGMLEQLFQTVNGAVTAGKRKVSKPRAVKPAVADGTAVDIKTVPATGAVITADEVAMQGAAS